MVENLPPDSGLLAFFCLACPQPGINLPNDWESDPERSSYTRTFVSDGNFSAKHQINKKARPAPALTAGDLFMVEETNYAAHLFVASEEIDEVCIYIPGNPHYLPLNVRKVPVISTVPSLIDSQSMKAWMLVGSARLPVRGMVHFARAASLIFSVVNGGYLFFLQVKLCIYDPLVR